MAQIQYTAFLYHVSFTPDGRVIDAPDIYARGDGSEPTVIPWFCRDGMGLTIRVEATFPWDAVTLAQAVRQQYLEAR